MLKAQREEDTYTRAYTYMFLISHQRDVCHWIRAHKRGRRVTVSPADNNMNNNVGVKAYNL